jgi:hypothetical protein
LRRFNSANGSDGFYMELGTVSTESVAVYELSELVQKSLMIIGQ